MFVYAILFVGALLLTFFTLQLARRRGLIDAPNERSSHLVPTPRGGGIGMVIPFLLYLPLAWISGVVPTEPFIALWGAAFIVALLGFIDDLYNLSARMRLLIQALAVLWALLWIGQLWLYSLLFNPWLGPVLVALGILWWLNLYNFMDGIDGLAALEALAIALGAALLLWLSGQPQLQPVWLALAAVVAGFLVFNWAPARIFMGDVGSCFLGLVIALLALITLQAQQISLWGWLILTALFWSDATLTLLRRALRGERLHQAHRCHAYQILARRWGSHRRVALVAGAVNVLWLWPLACWEVYQPDYGLALALLACLPLLLVEWWLGAGDSTR